MGSGLNFFANAYDKTPTQTGWRDVDCGGQIPTGSTGVILEVQNTSGLDDIACEFRKNGSTRSLGAVVRTDKQSGILFVGVDANRIFEANLGNINIKVWLIGYTDSSVTFFDDGSIQTITPTVTGSWQDRDLSSYIPSDATGVICQVWTGSAGGCSAGVRKNGSTSEVPYLAVNSWGASGGIVLCGCDTNRIIEAKFSAITGRYLYLLGYTKSPITWKDNPDDISLTATSAWTDKDITTQTAADADGAIILIKVANTWDNYNANIRKNGSTDNRTTNEQIGADNLYQGVYRGIGLDSGQIFEGWIANTVMDFYLIGYAKPSAVVKEVTDTFSLADSILRNKTLTISDSVGLAETPLKSWIPQISDVVAVADSVLCSKILSISDSLGLSELIEVMAGAIIKYVTDSIGLSDLVLRDKILTILENISLTDLVKAAILLEAPVLVLTQDGHLVLRVTKPTQKKPEYILLR